MEQRILDLVSRKIPTLSDMNTIKDAAEIMEKEGSTYVLIKNSKGKICGIVTEGDLRRAILQEMNVRENIKSIMSESLIKIDANCMLWEATADFFRNKIKHLPVEKNGRIIGVLTIKDLAFFLSRIPLYFLKEFSRARNINEIKSSYEKFQKYTFQILPKELERESINSRYMGNIITMIDDEIMKSVIRLVLKKMNISREKFSFFVMGSEGRMEQFLRTDQDNALIFSNSGNKKQFVELGNEIHTSLLEIGFANCPAGYTVGNEKFVQNVDEWLSIIEHWSYTLSSEDLLNMAVFGDMRHVYGNKDLFLRVNRRLYSLCKNEIIFRKSLDVSLGFSIPLKPKKINLKNDALLPLIAPIRVLSLKFDIHETNTFDRIERLKEKKVLSKELASNLEIGYRFLKDLDFMIQINNILSGNDKNTIHDMDVRKQIPKIKSKFLEDSLKTISEFHNLIRGKYLYYTTSFM